MELYLIRHAEALDLGVQGITTDEERPLSEKGKRQAKAAARALQARGVVLDRLYASPLVRTQQTAEILVRVWARPDLAMETANLLAPGGKPRKLSKFLINSGGAKIGLVGHMPDLADYAAWLIGAREAQIDMAKAGAALVTFGDAPGKGLGTLQWLVTPEWF